MLVVLATRGIPGADTALMAAFRRNAVAWAGIPFGGLVGGAAVTAVGLSPVLLVFGLTYLAATTLPGLQKEWREMGGSDRRVMGGPGLRAARHQG